MFNKNKRKSSLNKKNYEEKLHEEKKFQEKILIPNPRKLLLGIANPYLASEFSYHMAKYTSLNVLLIDADGLNPIISYCLGMKEVVNEKIISTNDSNSAFNIALDYISKYQNPIYDILKNISVRHLKNKNLHVLTGNDDIEKYENYSDTSFELLLKYSIDIFDLVIVNVPYNIYDSFYLTTLEHAEFMVYGFSAYADNIMSYNRLIKFLYNCGRTNINKHQYVPFNYIPTRQLSKHDISLGVDNQVLGFITDDKNRQLYNNEFNKSYACNMSKKNINEYHKLAKSFGYESKIGILNKGIFKIIRKKVL